MSGFKPGVSGNPAGRKPGSFIGSKIRAAIAERKEELLETVFNKAFEGDMQACKMLLDRLVAPLKPVADVITVKPPTGAGLSEQGAAIVTALLAGRLAPDVGVQLLTALAAQAKLVEVTELERRIEALEAADK